MRMMCLSLYLVVSLLLLHPFAFCAEHPGPSVQVTATACDYSEVPFTLELATPCEFATITLRQTAPQAEVPCQFVKTNGKVRITWLIRDLKKGTSRTYQIRFDAEPSPTAQGVVVQESKEIKGGFDVLIDGALFTTYHTADVPRPFCYPVIGPTGRSITRHFPMKKLAGESTDHPHHRSFWIAFEPVNQVNFWTDSPKSGKIMHRSFESKISGPVFGLIRASNDWVAPDGKKICEDTRELRVYRLTHGRLFDFEIIFRATEGPLTFGDSKEGMFAFRVADSMRLKGGGGHIENSRGDKDGTTWGKQAEWCDYYGPVDGDIVGIAVLDHPSNLRHPTFWHVRDYGLFAANPFGLRAFTRDKTKDGSYTVPVGSTLSFRYRVYLHRGTTAEAKIADLWTTYTHLPKVEVR